MSNDVDPDILIQAEAAYKGAITNPGTFRHQAGRLVIEARRLHNAEALVVALHALARCHYAQLEHPTAKSLLDQAGRVARRHHFDARLADVLISRAGVNIELGMLSPAQRDLDLAGRVVSARSRVGLLHQQAVLHHNAGRHSEAAATYRELITLPDVLPEVLAKVANNLALIESDRGRPLVALALLDRAAAAAELTGPAIVAGVTQSRGRVLMQAGRLVESLREFDEAGRIYESAGWALGEHYLEYADALADLRLLPEARTTAQHAYDDFDQHGVRLMAAEAQLLVAQLALLDGEPATAMTAAQGVISSMRRQRREVLIAKAAATAARAGVRTGNPSQPLLVQAQRAADRLEQLGIVAGAVEAHLTAGRIALARNRGADALASLQRSAGLSRGLPVLTRLRGRIAAALAAQIENRDRDVLRHCRAGLADLDAHRSVFASMELRALASGHGAELGELGLATLVAGGSPARVLGWMERTRAAALLSVETPAVEGIEDKLASLRGVQAELAQSRRDTGEEPAELVHRQASIESQIRRAAWTGKSEAATTTELPTLNELRQLLAGRILVEYAAVGGELVAAVLDSRRARLFRLGPIAGAQRESEALLFALRRLSRRRSPVTTKAAREATAEGLTRLQAMLIAPLKLPADTPLVVVPVGELQRIPWAPLHTAPVSVAPSASFWAATLQRKSSSNHVVLVAGPQLPGAVLEVKRLRDVHPAATVLVPPHSTVDDVAAALRGADLAHLSCHGALRADNPTFSSLLFSDGPLTVQELALRGLAPHRMVLASCDTGADVVYEGNEMLGFVSALMARGTAGLVASMALLPDEDAVPLMLRLHERIVAGDCLADALHHARLAIDTTDDSAFLTWCAFNAFGAA